MAELVKVVVDADVYKRQLTEFVKHAEATIRKKSLKLKTNENVKRQNPEKGSVFLLKKSFSPGK